MEIFGRIKPFSQPGQEKKNKLEFYGHGQESLLERQWDKLQFCLDLIKNDKQLEPIKHLRKIKQTEIINEEHSTWGKIELACLTSIINGIHQLKFFLQKQPQNFWPLELETTQLIKLLQPHSEKGEFSINPKVDPELKKNRSRAAQAQNKYLQLEKKHRNQVAKLLEIKPVSLRTDLVVSRNNQQLVKDISRIKSLVKIDEEPNSLRFRLVGSPEIDKARQKYFEFQKQVAQIEKKIIKQIAFEISARKQAVFQALKTLGDFDLTLAKAILALDFNMIRPQLTAKPKFTFQEGINPVIKNQVEDEGFEYQSLTISTSARAVNIVGANMGGKTAFLRTCGLFQLMTQFGLFIPARHFSTSLFNSIYWTGATTDNPAKGLSSFGREITDLQNYLQQPFPLFLLLDEFARTTDVEHGLALSLALVDYQLTSNSSSLSIFAGHIGEISKHPEVQGFEIGRLRLPPELKRDKFDLDFLKKHMDYSVKEGRTGKADTTFKIAAFLGLEPKITEKAAKYFSN